MSYKGKYSPKNPKKYVGNSKDITYRSLKERSIMAFFDESDHVLRWSSETVVVPYVYSIDNSVHRYFVDFFMEMRCRSGNIVKIIIEYKPHIQTLPPKKPKTRKGESRYLSEQLTYIKNQDKWKHAKEFAKKNSLDFVVITEHDIKGMNFFKKCFEQL